MAGPLPQAGTRGTLVGRERGQGSGRLRGGLVETKKGSRVRDGGGLAVRWLRAALATVRRSTQCKAVIASSSSSAAAWDRWCRWDVGWWR
jgi:hypothetical protein